jgi:RimJ/RimL family protein N-acetyltransferase
MSWWIFPSYRRRGFASRAVRLATHYAFQALGVREIEALVESDNLASLGVVRNTGFVAFEEAQEGHPRLVRHVMVPLHQ